MNSIESQFVPYSLAVKMKELGMNTPVLAWYNGSQELEFENRYGAMSCIDAPLWQQCFDWFSDIHDLLGVVDLSKVFYGYHIRNLRSHDQTEQTSGQSYESARLACLEKLIELVSNKG